MGKSKRIRSDRAQDLLTSPERYSDIKATKKARKTTIILVCVIAAIILASVALIILNETGTFTRAMVLYKTENFKITGTMAQYMYVDLYQQYVSIYGEYMQYFGIDVASQVTTSAKTILSQCEAANAAGKALSDADHDEIDKAIKELKKDLKENNSSISKAYGNANESDIRKVMELKLLASKIADETEDEFLDKIIVNNDRINKYFEDNKSSFIKGDYIKVSVNEEYFKKFEEAKEKEDFSAEDFKKLFIEYYVKENLLTNYNAKAGAANKVEALDASVFDAVEAIVNYYICDVKDDKIKDVKLEDVLDMDEVSISKDKFKEIYTKFKADGDKTTEAMYENLGKVAADMCDKVNSAMEIKADYAYTDKPTATTTTTTTTTATTTTATTTTAATTTAGAAAQAEDSEATGTTTAGTTASTDNGPSSAEVTDAFNKWFFAEGARKENDIFTAEDGKTVYIVTKVAEKETYLTKNVCHILIKVDDEDDTAAFAEAEKEAKEVLAKFLQGNKTKEAFEALAKEYTDDGGVYYKNVPKGQMVEEFENWIYDSSRKPTDTGLVKTQYGWHVMFFVKDGLEAWKASVVDTLLNEDLTNWNAELLTKYPVTTVDKNVAKIFG